MDEKDPPFWSVFESLEVLTAIDEQDRRQNHAVVITNAVDVQTFQRQYKVKDLTIPIYEQEMRRLRLPENAVIPQLKVLFGGFDFDFFMTQGVWFVSSRFREVADLPGTAAQYFPVDTGQCHPDTQAKDYRMMWITAVHDILDPEKCDFHRKNQWGGQDWKLGFRTDFDPPDPIFHIQRHGFLFCTDAFAEKILRAGLTGIEFCDVTRLKPDGYALKQLAA